MWFVRNGRYARSVLQYNTKTQWPQEFTRRILPLKELYSFEVLYGIMSVYLLPSYIYRCVGQSSLTKLNLFFFKPRIYLFFRFSFVIHHTFLMFFTYVHFLLEPLGWMCNYYYVFNIRYCTRNIDFFYLFNKIIKALNIQYDTWVFDRNKRK